MKLLEQFTKYGANTVFIYDSVSYSYDWLKKEVEQYLKIFEVLINSGDVVQLCADYSPTAIAFFIMLACKNAIIAPLTNIPEAKLKEYSTIMHPQMRITISENQGYEWERPLPDSRNNQEIINALRDRNNPGLIIMSSGTTGNNKAILHDLGNIFDVQKSTRNHNNILSFLLFDHIGGINTMINALISGNTLVLPKKKDINTIAQLMQAHSVHVLITSPSCLNLMTINGVWDKINLSSLKHINYGGEVMPSHLLKTLSEVMPNTKISQSYGTSETGVLKTTSENNQSPLIKVKDANNIRVVEGKLEIKSHTSMLGYLNAPTPFTHDGWFKTGDIVEVHGEWLRVLGRESDIINVGGKKVFPTEVENAILQIPRVCEVSVGSESNALLGSIIKASVFMDSELPNIEKTKIIRAHCFKNLEDYKVPQKFEFIDQAAYCRRYKKLRHFNSQGANT